MRPARLVALLLVAMLTVAAHAHAQDTTPPTVNSPTQASAKTQRGGDMTWWQQALIAFGANIVSGFVILYAAIRFGKRYVSRLQGTLLRNDSTSMVKRLLSAAVATERVPKITDDGKAVDPWYDIFGRQVIFGADMSTGSISVHDIAPALMQVRFSPIATAESEKTHSRAVEISFYSKLSFYVRVGGASACPCEVAIQSSPDSKAWADAAKLDIEDEQLHILTSQAKHKYVRLVWSTKQSEDKVTVDAWMLCGY